MADNKLPFALSFERQYAGPLDPTTVFETYADMQAYLTNETRYAGQISVANDSPGKLYILNSTRAEWRTHQLLTLVPEQGTAPGLTAFRLHIETEDGEITITKDTPIEDRFIDALKYPLISGRFSYIYSRGTYLGKTDTSGRWRTTLSQGYIRGTVDTAGVSVELYDQTLVSYDTDTNSLRFSDINIYYFKYYNVRIPYGQGIQRYDSNNIPYLSPAGASTHYMTLNDCYILPLYPVFVKSSVGITAYPTQIDVLYTDYEPLLKIENVEIIESENYIPEIITGRFTLIFAEGSDTLTILAESYLYIDRIECDGQDIKNQLSTQSIQINNYAFDVYRLILAEPLSNDMTIQLYIETNVY